MKLLRIVFFIPFLFFVPFLFSKTTGVNNDSSNASYYMVGNMMYNLPSDPVIVVDTIKSNKLTVFTVPTNNDTRTMVSIIYKGGTLSEDSTRKGYVHFLTSYMKSYYREKLSQLFADSLILKADAVAKPGFSYISFDINSSKVTDKQFYTDLFSVLSDSVDFNNTVLFDKIKSSYMYSYDKIYQNELPYSIKKRVSNKYLSLISPKKAHAFFLNYFRPNQMAVVIAGNIDTAYVHKFAMDKFAALKNPGILPKKDVVNTKSNVSQLLYAYCTDSSLTDKARLDFYFLTNRNNRSSQIGYIETQIGNVGAATLEYIVQKFIKENNITNLNASFSYFPFSRSTDALLFSATCDSNYMNTFLLELMNFTESLKLESSINMSDLEYSKINYLKKYELISKGQISIDDHFENILNYFLYGQPMVSKKHLFELFDSFIDKTHVPEITTYLRNGYNKENTHIVISCPPGSNLTIKSKADLIKKYEAYKKIKQQQAGK